MRMPELNLEPESTPNERVFAYALSKHIHQIKLVYLVNIQLLFIIEHLFIQLYVNGRINSPEYTT